MIKLCYTSDALTSVVICIVINVSYYLQYNFSAHDAGHKYAHVQSLLLHSVSWTSRCPDADQILPKLPHYVKSSAALVNGATALCMRWSLHCGLTLDLVFYYYLLTSSLGQSPPWEANSSSASQEIPCILWSLDVHYRIHNSPPPVAILSKVFSELPQHKLYQHYVNWAEKRNIA